MRPNVEVIDQPCARCSSYLHTDCYGDSLVRWQSCPVAGYGAAVLRRRRRGTGGRPGTAGKTVAHEAGPGRERIGNNQIVAVVRPLIADQQAISYGISLVGCGWSRGREQSKIGRDDHLGNERVTVTFESRLESVGRYREIGRARVSTNPCVPGGINPDGPAARRVAAAQQR